MPVIAYIGLGSNLGDRERNVLQAVELLAASVQVTAVSSLYCTEPVGRGDQADFINAAVQIGTTLSAAELLSLCRSIEDRMGRSRDERWGPRTIDLDILLYGDAVLDLPGLVVPHPRMAGRRFVLEPLAEIAPQAVHPRLRRTAAQLLQDLPDPHRVMRCGTGGANP
jgi:2-amino-4-hydroxy-6-hydroxymethyldihydropteridine diphosphokinase